MCEHLRASVCSTVRFLKVTVSILSPIVGTVRTTSPSRSISTRFQASGMLQLAEALVGRCALRMVVFPALSRPSIRTRTSVLNPSTCADRSKFTLTGFSSLEAQQREHPMKYAFQVRWVICGRAALTVQNIELIAILMGEHMAPANHSRRAAALVAVKNIDRMPWRSLCADLRQVGDRRAPHVPVAQIGTKPASLCSLARLDLASLCTECDDPRCWYLVGHTATSQPAAWRSFSSADGRKAGA
eukprot:SAG31_NODE_686_length_12815_cov_5.367175_6_plen_243_part_00